MDGAQSLCAPMSMQISSSEPSPLCAACNHGCGAYARYKGRGGSSGGLFVTGIHGGGAFDRHEGRGGAGGSGASALQVVIGAAALIVARGGAEVHGGCTDDEAGNPTSVTSIVFPLGGVP